MKKAICEVYYSEIDEYGFEEIDLDWLARVSGKDELHVGNSLYINSDNYKILEVK